MTQTILITTVDRQQSNIRFEIGQLILDAIIWNTVARVIDPYVTKLKNISQKSNLGRDSAPFTQRTITAPKGFSGLSGLQKSTMSIMNKPARSCGVSGSDLTVNRQKINNDIWQLTVENPRTRKIILQVEGPSDKLFSQEDNLARMAEILLDQELKISTQFSS